MSFSKFIHVIVIDSTRSLNDYNEVLTLEVKGTSKDEVRD